MIDSLTQTLKTGSMIGSLTQTLKTGSMIGSHTNIKDGVHDRLSHTNIKDWVHDRLSHTNIKDRVHAAFARATPRCQTWRLCKRVRRLLLYYYYRNLPTLRLQPHQVVSRGPTPQRDFCHFRVSPEQTRSCYKTHYLVFHANKTLLRLALPGW